MMLNSLMMLSMGQLIHRPAVQLMPWLNQRPWKYSHYPKCGGHDCVLELRAGDIAEASTLAFPFGGPLVGDNESLTRAALAEYQRRKLPVMFDVQAILFAPWHDHWFDGDCAGPYELGLQSLPKTRATYARMASALKSDAWDSNRGMPAGGDALDSVITRSKSAPAVAEPEEHWPGELHDPYELGLQLLPKIRAACSRMATALKSDDGGDALDSDDSDDSDDSENTGDPFDSTPTYSDLPPPPPPPTIAANALPTAQCIDGSPAVVYANASTAATWVIQVG
jgi:hypothetical protein